MARTPPPQFWLTKYSFGLFITQQQATGIALRGFAIPQWQSREYRVLSVLGLHGTGQMLKESMLSFLQHLAPRLSVVRPRVISSAFHGYVTIEPKWASYFPKSWIQCFSTCCVHFLWQQDSHTNLGMASIPKRDCRQTLLKVEFLLSAGDWTQGLTCAKHVLHHPEPYS